MPSKWSTPQQNSLKQSGVTLIETLVALGLLVGIFLMWHPVIVSLGKFNPPDAELLAVETFERAVQNEVTLNDSLTVDLQKLVIKNDSRSKTVQKYSGNSGDMIIFSTPDRGGFEPILTEVYQIEWTPLPHAVAYHLNMKSGRSYEGVIVDGEKAR